jgi:hypothetical protein
MAAIVDPEQKIGQKQLDTFAEKMKNQLPAYARPMFLRLCNEVDKTGGNFKILQKLQS